ncbi:PREDICTED: sperm acrosome membrane-associated protein 6 [Aptenodytes forsteri]|uniref:sperm acrosome membrane-associated protein 6 n=1 Tax=Aptenodytes forsteri TaxID=9233 RepID=UPI000905A0BA|nr:PREDICTED: sperm acrosome membrane-associated protein 6 [Aptenodytes forsteri]
MGSWWVLVLAPWLPGNPGIQARGPGLWQWVALASWLPGVHPCLLCFGPPIQRARLCRDITGAPLNDPRHRHCLEALVQAAVPLASVTVGSGQRKALREIIMDALHFLEKQKDMKPFEVSLQEAIDIIWVKLSHLEEAPACIPPCGYQPAARVFQCATCRLVDCQFPLDCPVQDVWAHADEAITLHCDVPFATPPDLPITWMFAKDLRTQDLALFEELQGGAEGPLSLTLQDPTPGTIACRLGFLSESLVRKYFYLNVSGGSMEAEQGLQTRFRAVLRWPHGRTSLHHTASLGLGLALGSMALVLLLVATWQCRSLPELSDPWTSHRPGQQGPPGDSRCLDSP